MQKAKGVCIYFCHFVSCLQSVSNRSLPHSIPSKVWLLVQRIGPVSLPALEMQLNLHFQSQLFIYPSCLIYQSSLPALKLFSIRTDTDEYCVQLSAELWFGYRRSGSKRVCTERESELPRLTRRRGTADSYLDRKTRVAEEDSGGENIHFYYMSHSSKHHSNFLNTHRHIQYDNQYLTYAHIRPLPKIVTGQALKKLHHGPCCYSSSHHCWCCCAFFPSSLPLPLFLIFCTHHELPTQIHLIISGRTMKLTHKKYPAISS